ncbi:MAG: hypothetical protein ACTHKZ_03735 [Lysobacteraceae bacterium]
MPEPMTPRDWGEAFAALPMDAAPADTWRRVAARLDARPPRARWPRWLAAAAVLVLAIALPWRSWFEHARLPATAPSAQADPALARLQAESAQLEGLLAYARDERVASGSAATLSAQLDARVAAIDAALMQPGLAAARQQALWRERVEALRTLAAFEANRRWLASQGERYDGALVRVD